MGTFPLFAFVGVPAADIEPGEGRLACALAATPVLGGTTILIDGQRTRSQSSNPSDSFRIHMRKICVPSQPNTLGLSRRNRQSQMCSALPWSGLRGPKSWACDTLGRVPFAERWVEFVSVQYLEVW